MTGPISFISPEARELGQRLAGERRVSADGITATVPLPEPDPETVRTLAHAIVWLLRKYFRIELVPDQVMAIEHAPQCSFTISGPQKQLDRTVFVDRLGPPPVVRITGIPPQDGEDGYSEIAFDWERKSGRIQEDGTIDWRKINSVPSVRAHSLLATIYDRTPGLPGLDCQGRAIRQRLGRRQQVYWKKDSVYRKNDPGNPRAFHLHAKRSGVVVFAFDQPGNPRRLATISVAETLKIPGDIDYSVGDIETAANLEIGGSVRGNFSLHSEGYIHVRDSVEGKEVEATRVEADVIANCCTVRAREEVQVGNITNATAMGGEIEIRTSACQAMLRAGRSVTFSPESSAMGVVIETMQACFDRVNLTGQIEIVLAPWLFERAARIIPQLGELEARIAETATQVREAVLEILAILPQLEKYPLFHQSTVLRNLFARVKAELASQFKDGARVPPETMARCSMLKEKAEEKLFDYSLSRKLDKLCQGLPAYNQIQKYFQELKHQRSGDHKQLTGIADQLRSQLAVVIRGGRPGDNLQVKVRAGDQETSLDSRQLRQLGDLTVHYQADADPLKICQGKLVVRRGRG